MGRPKQPVLIVDQLDEAYRQAKETKRRVRLKFSKREYLTQNPDTPPDPRFALTGNTVTIDFETYTRITVKELRDMCIANPDHPLAATKRASVMGLDDSQTIAVLHQDLQDLKEGYRKVQVESPELLVVEKTAIEPFPLPSQEDEVIQDSNSIYEGIDIPTNPN